MYVLAKGQNSAEQNGARAYNLFSNIKKIKQNNVWKKSGDYSFWGCFNVFGLKKPYLNSNLHTIWIVLYIYACTIHIGCTDIGYNLCMSDFLLPLNSLNAPSNQWQRKDKRNITVIHFFFRSPPKVCQSIFWIGSYGSHCCSCKAITGYGCLFR